MVNISREDLDFLMSITGSALDDGMQNYTFEDYIKYEEIEKKYGEK